MALQRQFSIENQMRNPGEGEQIPGRKRTLFGGSRNSVRLEPEWFPQVATLD